MSNGPDDNASHLRVTDKTFEVAGSARGYKEDKGNQHEACDKRASEERWIVDSDRSGGFPAPDDQPDREHDVEGNSPL